MLLGICSELAIHNLLIVQVSPHTRRTIEEHDAARRLMFAAREDQALPKGYDVGLLQLHAKKPFVTTPAEIAERAAQVRDSNFRIEVAEDGIHIYNRYGHHIAKTAMALFPLLGVEKGRRAWLLSRHRIGESRNRLRARQALRAGRVARLGRRNDKAEEEDLLRLREAGIRCARKTPKSEEP